MKTDRELLEIAGSLTKKQKEYLIEIGESWAYKDIKHTITKNLIKKGLFKKYINNDCVCRSELGDIVAEFIIRAAAIGEGME